jgi:hypothetical protein
MDADDRVVKFRAELKSPDDLGPRIVYKVSELEALTVEG